MRAWAHAVRRAVSPSRKGRPPSGGAKVGGGLSRARGVMAGEVRTHTEVLDAEQTRLSNSIEKLPTTRGEVGAFVKSPARLGGHRPDASPAPKVGQDTDEILDIIEIAPGAREDLRKRGVVS